MNNTMEYKGYIGSVEFSEADEILYGKVLGIHSLISYEGDSASSLLRDFHAAVDEYLRLCEDEGCKPERPYKGSFNVRISPALHKQAAVAAISSNISLNSFVENSIRSALSVMENVGHERP